MHCTPAPLPCPKLQKILSFQSCMKLEVPVELSMVLTCIDQGHTEGQDSMNDKFGLTYTELEVSEYPQKNRYLVEKRFYSPRIHEVHKFSQGFDQSPACQLLIDVQPKIGSNTLFYCLAFYVEEVRYQLINSYPYVYAPLAELRKLFIRG